MKVTLAYPYGDHEPDTTIDLPDAEAQRLVNDGKARQASKYVKAAKVDPQTTEEH
jgi:hypothetical protein